MRRQILHPIQTKPSHRRTKTKKNNQTNQRQKPTKTIKKLPDWTPIQRTLHDSLKRNQRLLHPPRKRRNKTRTPNPPNQTSRRSTRRLHPTTRKKTMDHRNQNINVPTLRPAPRHTRHNNHRNKRRKPKKNPNHTKTKNHTIQKTLRSQRHQTRRLQRSLPHPPKNT